MVAVETLMNRAILKIPSEATVREAARMMEHHRVGSLLVTKDGDYAGIFTETDLARRVIAEDRDPHTTPVGAVMSSPIATIETEEPVVEAWNLMRVCGVRHLAVTAIGRIVGVVSLRDLLRPVYGRDMWATGRSR